MPFPFEIRGSDGTVYNKVGSSRGWRTLNGKPDYHDGFDIPAEGEVIYTGFGLGETARVRTVVSPQEAKNSSNIGLQHAGALIDIQFQGLPFALDERILHGIPLVEPGTYLKPGMPILRITKNGNATGPHAHCETYLNGANTPLSKIQYRLELAARTPKAESLQASLQSTYIPTLR